MRIRRLRTPADLNEASRRGRPPAHATRRILTGAAMASCLLALWGCAPEPTAPPPPPPGALPAGQAIGSAAIQGRVVFDGPPPARRPIRMSSEAACHKPSYTPMIQNLLL